MEPQARVVGRRKQWTSRKSQGVPQAATQAGGRASRPARTLFVHTRGLHRAVVRASHGLPRPSWRTPWQPGTPASAHKPWRTSRACRDRYTQTPGLASRGTPALVFRYKASCHQPVPGQPRDAMPARARLFPHALLAGEGQGEQQQFRCASRVSTRPVALALCSLRRYTPSNPPPPSSTRSRRPALLNISTTARAQKGEAGKAPLQRHASGRGAHASGSQARGAQAPRADGAGAGGGAPMSSAHHGRLGGLDAGVHGLGVHGGVVHLLLDLGDKVLVGGEDLVDGALEPAQR